MDDYHIEELNPNNENDWEEFNRQIDGGSFFHTLKWKNIMENSFDYKLHYYLIYLNGKVIALCPFCENAFRGFKGLMSIPNSDYRHFLINKQDYNHLEEIVKKIIEIAKTKNYSFVMITTLTSEVKDYLKKYHPLPFPIFSNSGNFNLDLKINPPEKIWHDIFRYKTRNTIKKMEKDGLKIREANSLDDLKIFYKYYKINLEYKDRHPHSFTHFEKLWATYPPTEMRTTLLCQDENIHGGLLTFIYPPSKTMYCRYIAIDRDIRARYKVADYMHWECVQFASNMKFNTVCFGETPGDPNDATYKYKKSFGGNYEQIYSFILPLSFTFRIGYNLYKYFNLTQQFRRIKNKQNTQSDTSTE
jgi:hypothetical protein